MSELYNNSDPALDVMLSQVQQMDITTFASVASEEEETPLYGNGPNEQELEETTVDEIFDEFGAPPEPQPVLPAWLQKHQSDVTGLRNAQQDSQNLSKPGLTNLAGGQYHLEKLDHKHRMGDVLQALYSDWAYSPDAAGGKGFFEWLDSLSYFQTYARLKAIKGQEFASFNTPAFMKGVEYLDKHSRRHYQVILSTRQNCMLWNGRPLNTANLQTVFSGKGWGAWVLSGTDKFYTGPHIKGQFHHSSFLSGGLVKAAGEWKVENGRLKYITGKTGHYRCPIEKLVEALNVMQKRIGLGGANVVVWNKDPRTSKPVEFPAIVFLSNPAMQEEYVAIGKDSLHEPVRDKPKMQIGAHRAQP